MSVDHFNTIDTYWDIQEMHSNRSDRRCDSFVRLNDQWRLRRVTRATFTWLLQWRKRAGKKVIVEGSFEKCISSTWKMTRDFSSRYTSISAPAIFPVGPKWIRMNLPWREIQRKHPDTRKASLVSSENDSHIQGRTTYESRGIVVSSCLCIAIRFQDRI